MQIPVATSITMVQSARITAILSVAISIAGCATPQVETKKYEPTDLTLGIVPTCSLLQSDTDFGVQLTSALEHYGMFKVVGQAIPPMDKSFDLIVVCNVMTSGLAAVNINSAYSGALIVNKIQDFSIFSLGNIKLDARAIAAKFAQTLSRNSPAYKMVMAERDSFRKDTDKGMIVAKAPAIRPHVHSDVDKPKYSFPEDASRYAIVVGIEKYHNLPDAAFAERDAETVREHLLAMGYPSRNVVLLTGTAASRAGLAKNLETWLPNNVK